MNHTRIGKIARLPQDIREELGRSLENGHSGREIVEWLNTEPSVRSALCTYFDGRGITEQNLSEWKSGGHQDWLRQQRAEQLVAGLAEQARGLDQAAGHREVSDRLAAILAAEMAAVAASLFTAEPDPAKRWDRLCAAQERLGRLRARDHRAAALELAREKWARQRQREDAAAAEAAERERQRVECEVCLAKQKLPGLAETMGGGPGGERKARAVLEYQHRLPAGRLDPDFDAREFKRLGRRQADDDMVDEIGLAALAAAEQEEAGARACDFPSVPAPGPETAPNHPVPSAPVVPAPVPDDSNLIQVNPSESNLSITPPAVQPENPVDEAAVNGLPTPAAEATDEPFQGESSQIQANPSESNLSETLASLDGLAAAADAGDGPLPAAKST